MAKDNAAAKSPPYRETVSDRATPAFRHRMNHIGFASGVLTILLGVAVLYLIGHLDPGTARRMGPAFWPQLLAGTSIGLGVILVALATRGPFERLVAPAMRPLVCVLGAIVAFGLTVERLGLLLAVALTVTVAGAAHKSTRPVELAVVAVALSLFIGLVFVEGLGLPLPYLP